MGRERALGALVEALGRGPLAVLVGGGGMGKSGLARVVAHQLEAQDGSPSIQVQLRPDDGIAAMLTGIVRALGSESVDGEGAGAGKVAPDASEGLESLMEEALSAAESRKAVVIMEDLHHVADGVISAWLELVSSYARDSRWIATTRNGAVHAGLREQIVELGPLDADAITRLVEKCAPDSEQDARQALVRMAAGSPLEARRLAVGLGQARAQGASHPPQAARPEPVLAQLPAAARPFLETLAHTTLPLELNDVQSAVTLPASDVLELLAMAGILVNEGGQRVRLHDAIRGRIASEMEPVRTGEVRQALAKGLGEKTDPDAILEALRSGLDEVDKAPVKALMERRWTALVESGSAERVWRLLRHHGFELRSMAIRAAIATGTAEALRWAAVEPAPPGDDLRLRYDWLDARRRMAVGQQSLVSDAIALAETATAAGDERHAFDATLMAADVAYSLGQLDTTTDLLAAIEKGTSDIEGLVRRDALNARICEIRGDHAEANSWALRARQRAEVLPPAKRLAALRRCHFVSVVAHPSDAPDIPTDGGFWPCFLAGTQACFNGDGEKGQAALDAVQALEFNNVTETVMAELLGMFRGLVVGATSDMYTAGVTSLHRARVAQDWVGLQWSVLGHSLAAWAAIRPAPHVPWPEGLPGPGAAVAGLVTLVEDLHRLDMDPEATPTRTPQASLGEADRASVPLDLADALAHGLFTLMMGKFNESLVATARAVRLAAAPGMRFVEFIIRSGQLFTFAALGRESDLQRGVESYGDLVQSMTSGMAERGVAFMEAVFGPQLQVAGLEALADDWERNAVTAHWARRLITGELPARRSHRLVVSIVTERWEALAIERYNAVTGDWQRGWGLDLVQKQAWRVDGNVVDLSRRKTMRRLLECLAVGGGTATKEQLVERVWESEYHPLRDDTKLQVSMGRLRKLLGDSADAPVHILTTEDGYSTGLRPFTVVRREDDDSN